MSGLPEYKMSKRKTIKIRTFPGATISDRKFFIIPHLRKSPDKIVIHVGTNDAPHTTPQKMCNAIKDLKSFIQKYASESKIIISTPVLPVDKANANDRKSLIVISAYLKSRKEKTRIGSAFSDFINILFVVPQGSILGPVLFFLFITIWTMRAMLVIALLTFADKIMLKLLNF